MAPWLHRGAGTVGHMPSATHVARDIPPVWRTIDRGRVTAVLGRLDAAACERTDGGG